MHSKKVKVFELILVVAIAFWQSLYIAFYTELSGKPLSIDFNVNYYVAAFVNTILAVALMFYVIYRNGGTNNYIGLHLSFRWKDLLHGIGLYFLSLLILLITTIVLKEISPAFVQKATHQKNIEFFRNKNYIIFNVLLAIFIPVKEELIIRGFTMSKLFDLTKNKYLPVILSVAVQVSYHLYQGLPSALMLIIPFSIFALYFYKYKNLNAVVYVHIFTDIIAVTIFYFKK